MLPVELAGTLHRRAGREVEPEAAAGFAVGFNADFAGHFFDGFADDGKADAGAFIFGFGMDTLEHLEDAVLMFWFDADAIIFEPNANAAAY